ncbi:uncharacterized protein TNCT_290151 [Trichonephila clavata]|uniref:Uncharacterized protein n=1 Tax=Trichonephila clavata TaxID=2740835 RepID=A0A8X6HRQ7_TRICU|nr:uncharacterized protein TNCT_290151 [Trichonephila clavata]
MLRIDTGAVWSSDHGAPDHPGIHRDLPQRAIAVESEVFPLQQQSHQERRVQEDGEQTSRDLPQRRRRDGQAKDQRPQDQLPQRAEKADQESEPPIIDVTDGVEVQDMLRVDFDENMAFEREEMSDEYDEEFQVSSPESQSMRQMTNFSQNNHLPFKRRRNLSYKSEDQWYQKKEVSTSPTPDAQEVFGHYVASKLRQMDKSSQMLSERLISEVLFRGQMGLLTRSTSLTSDEPPPTIKVEE